MSLKKIHLLLPLVILFIFFPVIKSANSKKPEVKAYFTSSLPNPQKKVNSQSPTVTASSVYVLDLTSGQVLFEKNPHQKLQPASLTKIMTALVSLDFYKEDSILSVISGQKSLGSNVKLVAGDEILAKNILEGLLISSGNDAAITLAENYPGGYKAFVEKMNEKALELGLEDTHFSNVSGLESSDHYTTAFDISVIARTALTRPLFKQTVSKASEKFKSLKGNSYSLISTNILLDKSGYFGVKTGWTPQAGECLVLLVERDNHPILISLLHSSDRFGEAERITNWVYQNFSWN